MPLKQPTVAAGGGQFEGEGGHVPGELPTAGQDLELGELAIKPGPGNENMGLRLQALNGSQREGVAQGTAERGFMTRGHDVTTDVNDLNDVDGQEVNELAELALKADHALVWVEEVQARGQLCG
jgi:hypothetical protein